MDDMETSLVGRLDQLGKIFIGGTGRSGTTLLHQIIGTHPDAFLVPYESKFIVEGDGLVALVPQLCEDYTINLSDLTFIRFIETMGGRLKKYTTNPEFALSLNYQDRIGEEYYTPPLEEFITAVTDYEIDGFPVPRLFEDRTELISLARKLISVMFGNPTLDAEKKLWVEKTPSNIHAMAFLWELFPEAAIIHIKRDPRAVLHSFMQQTWIPAGLKPAAAMLDHIYWRWMRLRPTLDLHNRKYIEIKLEDLVRHPAETMAAVATILEVEPAFSLEHIEPDSVSRWQTEMPAEAREWCETHMTRYFGLMGYDI